MAAGVLLLAACGGSTVGPQAPSRPASPTTTPERRPTASPSIPPEFCERLGEVRLQLAQLLAVERRVANRGVLDDELAELQAAWDGLVQADRGPAEDALEQPMRQLGYRMTDVTISVEDYRTTSRPAEAAEHIARKGADFTAALAEVTALAGCAG